MKYCKKKQKQQQQKLKNGFIIFVVCAQKYVRRFIAHLTHYLKHYGSKQSKVGGYGS